jgi:hypothetical protein
MTVSNSNLKWYYSGGATNDDPSLSIGGVKSSVPLASSALNNLFDDVTGQEAVDGEDEYRLLYFENIDTDVNGLADPLLWISTQPPGDDDLGVGIADAGKSGEETAISDEFTAPADVSFSAPTSKGTGLALPDGPYVQNEYVGVWFKRHVPSGSGVTLSDACVFIVEGDTV